MDFPQQIEDTYGESLQSASPSPPYDAVMESPLYAAKDGKTTAGGAGKDPFALLPDKMHSSMNSSSLEDTTPSDSGVQMMDSESSELMIESITSQTGFEFEDAVRPAVAVAAPKMEPKAAGTDSNSNVTAVRPPDGDPMETSVCSTFDTAADNIVYRRKVRKSPATAKAPKKRVSFHEDILKNTRTDNIHIEHGFITYKNGRRVSQAAAAQAGRYSWCPEGDRSEQSAMQLHDDDEQGAGAAGGAAGRGGGGRRVVYRNACSDVLDYGHAEAYDTNETSGMLQYDNSGVFEYIAPGDEAARQMRAADGASAGDEELYRCSCSSSSNSSTSSDSDEHVDKNSNRPDYGQAKSSSCDCIGGSSHASNNNNLIGVNCYYSEPNIEHVLAKKSVWNKEKKPTSSCLKKTKRHTSVIHEQDLGQRMKKFNVHDMNQLIDNSSKMIIGSLKSIFTMPLTERGLPEGSEDLQTVAECVAELDATPEHKSAKLAAASSVGRPESPPLKAKPFLSKSLDGSRSSNPAPKKFVHNVDEQLRRKNDGEADADATTPRGGGNTEESAGHSVRTPLQRQEEVDADALERELKRSPVVPVVADVAEPVFRNKFIINCESTVFEHTGVSYCYETAEPFNAMSDEQLEARGNIASLIEQDTPVAQPEPVDFGRGTFIGTPLAKTFSNFFRSFKESASVASTPASANPKNLKTPTTSTKEPRTPQSLKMENSASVSSIASKASSTHSNQQKKASTSSDSPLSEVASSSAVGSSLQQQQQQSGPKSGTPLSSSYSNSLVIGSESRNNLDKQSRHLPSPLKKRPSGGSLMPQLPQRYGPTGQIASDFNSLFSPDLFNGSSASSRALGSGRDSKSTILSEEFDDILTITTDTAGNDSDIVIVDYPELSDRQSMADYAQLLKPPQPSTAKTSLINRFLRNVTQKKMLESTIRRNTFFTDKLRHEQKLFTGDLYVRGVRSKNYELIDDLNAEIAMEIEMSANSPRRELVSIGGDPELPGGVDMAARYELGMGEISVELFNGHQLPILRDTSEQVMKVFKLYTGYSREGFMTPVLVFLTDKSLYVTDLVRSRLCTKFVLPYADLDVILMGPFGNTVLLSNSERDMQQVLLAGGPYPADALVANLELCARRGGSSLPAVGQLTLQHLAPLQAFVRNHSSVTKEDPWMYYAVVNVPASALGSEKEPLGPHVKGFLMHRRIREYGGGHSSRQGWNPGYFLLKAGVLYMFNDSTQKLPSWAMALAECQGARRAFKTERPHCFEVLLKGQLLQLAAPDEYVASEWLQALLQSASGLFEMQEKHKTSGCSLVVTRNHLITLREDFTAPLRQQDAKADKPKGLSNGGGAETEDTSAVHLESTSVMSSTVSTPTRGAQRSYSSLNSTPTKMSQLSRSSLTGHTLPSLSTSLNASKLMTSLPPANEDKESSYSSMSSAYGKNSGVEILTCADIKDMTGIKIPSHNETWWCVLEFSCQEVRECPDDLVIFFASSSEMQRFLRLLEQLWQAKNNDLFPITILDEDDLIAEQCTMLYMDINRSWEPLISAALGYPL